MCNSNSDFVFSNKVLGKYDVAYYKCSNCESLQTETPYWLDEAYAENKEKFEIEKEFRQFLLQEN